MASSTPKKYDVFLSFQAKDIRNDFVGRLSEYLCRNKIATFMNKELRGGDELSPTLLKGIEESKIALVILSKNYAKSSQCLDELLKILECKEKLAQKVVLVLYHVDPADVGPEGRFKVALEEHKNRFDIDKVKHWTLALKKVAKLNGWTLLADISDTELIKAIAKDIWVQLDGAEPKVFDSDHKPCYEVSKESQWFLRQGGMKLTEPPKDEEWERLKEINLTDNGLSELPKNPRCPILEVLNLQGIRKLRMIDDSFFSNVPALQVLDLSRTRIKLLPDSLFKLRNLKRLSLKHCDLLKTLPSGVGELVDLEVLDLEGTEIMYLPEEIKQLINLTFLRVSFYEPMCRGLEQSGTVICSGIISALRCLQTLHLDLSPDDKRWNACVEAVVSEVCGLARLKSLKIYIPKVELLSHFSKNSSPTRFSSFSQFKFTVGQHANRIMSPLPSKAESELKRSYKCLKYINGAAVPEDIKLALRHATAFFLDRHATVETLSEFGFENMNLLECCVVGECNELQVLMGGDRSTTFRSLRFLYVYSLKNVRSLWDRHQYFPRLRSLTLRDCSKLTSLFIPNWLEKLVVDDCPVFTTLLMETTASLRGSTSLGFFQFPGTPTMLTRVKLKRMSLHFLPELTTISNLNLRRLQFMSVYYCPKLKSLPIDKALNRNLKEIKGEMSWWKALVWKSTQRGSWDDIFVQIDELDF